MSWSASRKGVIGSTPAGLEYKRKKAAEEVEVIITAKFVLNHTVFSPQQDFNKYGYMNGPCPVPTPYETQAERCSQHLNARRFLGHKVQIYVDKSKRESDMVHCVGIPAYELSDPETMIKFRRWIFDNIGALKWVTDNTGVVRFLNSEDLQKAIDMTEGSLVEGRMISVAPLPDDEENSLQVRGLHPKTQGRVLMEMFSQIGEVVEATGPGDAEPEDLIPNWHMQR